MKKTTINGPIFILIAAILWGTTGSSQSFAPKNASPYAIGALRMIIGGTALLVMAIFNGSFKGNIHLNKKNIFMAALCMAAYQPFFFIGVSMTGVALGTVLTIGSAPVFTGVIELFKGTKLSFMWIISTLLAVIGCIILFSGQDSMVMNIHGSLCSLAAGLMYAIYVQVTKELFQESPRDAINGLIFFTSGIILLPILFTQDLSWLLTQRGIITSMHLGLIATALAYYLFAKGLVHVSSPTAVTLTLGEPLTAALLGIFVFKEQLSIISLSGLGLLFVGLILTSLPLSNNKRNTLNTETPPY